MVLQASLARSVVKHQVTLKTTAGELRMAERLKRRS
jgi:hypothetical protein